MARRRGGYQKPSNPAAVSGPGALSARTDGRVPQMPRTGLAYGENKAVNEQQQAAPLSQTGTPGGGAPPSPRRALPTGDEGIFGGTDRPMEPMTAGIDWGAGEGAPPNPQMDDADNIDLAIRQAAKLTGSPHLLRLLDRVVR